MRYEKVSEKSVPSAGRNTSCMRCCGSGTGSHRSIRASIKVNTAVFAPMPSARVTITTALKPRWRVHIPDDHVQDGSGPIVPDAFPGLFDSAKLQDRETPRFCGRYPLANPVCHRHFDERLEIVFQLPLGAVALQQPPQG